MLRLFRLTAVSSSLLFLFLPEIALTSPPPILPVTSQFPTVSNSDTDTLVCYMQTQDGQILNLDRLCVKQRRDSNRSSGTGDSNSQAGSNATANSVAASPCFVVDSNGRPCTQ